LQEKIKTNELIKLKQKAIKPKNESMGLDLMGGERRKREERGKKPE